MCLLNSGYLLPRCYLSQLSMMPQTCIPEAIHYPHTGPCLTFRPASVDEDCSDLIFRSSDATHWQHSTHTVVPGLQGRSCTLNGAQRVSGTMRLTFASALASTLAPSSLRPLPWMPREEPSERSRLSAPPSCMLCSEPRTQNRQCGQWKAWFWMLRSARCPAWALPSSWDLPYSGQALNLIRNNWKTPNICSPIDDMFNFLGFSQNFNWGSPPVMGMLQYVWKIIVVSTYSCLIELTKRQGRVNNQDSSSWSEFLT